MRVITAAGALLEKGTYLENCKQCYGKTVEVGRGRAFLEVERSAKELHAQQGENQDEQEE